MPKLTTPLTTTQIKNAKPAAKPLTIFDGMETGLHVLIQPNGTRTFRLKAKIDGKDRRLTIGTFPEMGLAEAREEARKLKAQIKQGTDPTTPPAPAKTFAVVAGEFIEWKSNVIQRAGATIRKYRECLNNDLLPSLGNKPIEDIHPVEVVPLLLRINARSPSLAKKNQELVQMIVRYSITNGYRPPYSHLVLSGIIPAAKPRPKNIPTDPAATFKRIDDYPASVMRYTMKFQFLFFLRAGELMAARWDGVDWQRAELHIPACTMKMKRPHLVPLAKQALALLAELKELTGGTPFLFPSAHHDAHMCRDALSKAFRSINLGIIPHGCRTLAGTWLKNHKFAPYLVEAQLSHANKDEVEAAYEHDAHLLYLDERRVMMQAWADCLLPNHK